MNFRAVRRVAVLTSGRQDWGILRSTCKALREDPRFELLLLVGGMHLSHKHGHTEDTLREEGFSATARLPWLVTGDEPAETQTAGAVELTARALAELRPDMLLLVGDRFETAAAAISATLACVPIVHLHGGEETQGAFDNALRHAVTKMSHLHLVSHPLHAERVARMGELRESIHVVGAPGLDNLHRADLASRTELEAFLGCELTPPIVIVTHHPATLGDEARAEARAVVAAMRAVPATYVVTLPNADPGNAAVREELLAAHVPRLAVTSALGERRYFGLMRIANAMLGNSSSAIIEAPALGLPAVNVGERQRGRLRGANVVDVRADERDVRAGLIRALSPEFKSELTTELSPFGNGRSAPRILEILANWSPPRPPVKRSVEV